MIKKIQDERLKLENLKNIRTVFAIQTILLVSLWVYEAFIQGKGATGTPLTYVVLIPSIISALLNMRVSVENEDKPKSARSLFNSLTNIIILSIVVGIGSTLLLYVILGEGSLMDSLIMGGVFSLCIYGAFSYGYYVKKRHDEEEEE
ncbi:hypothetical protein ACERII_20560 [Evansella sp. AB-rgal1]|uniref:hypothetical protein n=1 Tax=Evansella sp. AB-rgal1 TaxID=3242696 RepID=UPI00359E7DC4